MSLSCLLQACNIQGRTIRRLGSGGLRIFICRSLLLKPKQPSLAPIVSSENDYIYKHIHGRLDDRFASIINSAQKLPIYPQIQQIQKTSDRDEFKKLLPKIQSQIQTMNQIELATLLAAIKNHSEVEYRIVKRMIDHELRWLLKEHVKTRLMDLDLWLYVADIFYECKIKSKFVQVLINYLSNEDVVLSNRQMLHLLFLIILQRDQDGILKRYEERIFHLLNRASFEDIAIICMAYFKTKTVIKNVELLRRIVDRTTDSLTTLDPKQPGYCSVIKCVRYSRNVECRKNVLHFIMSLTEQFNRRVIFASPYNAVHTIKLMESFRIYDPKLVHLMRVAMFQNLEEFRIKDIQYAMTSLSNFAYMELIPDESLKRDFDKLSEYIVQEIRQDVEFQYFHLIPLIRALATFGYYNDELIAYTNRVLSDPKKFECMKGVLEFEKSTLLVYVATMIEGGKEKLSNDSGILRELCASIERVGNFGTVKQDASLKHLDFILRGTCTKFYINSNLFRSIAKSLVLTKELQGPEYKFNFQYTLPHQNYADLVISKNKREPGSFHPYSLLPAKVPDDEKHCLIYAAQKTDYVDGYNRLSGYKRLINRLLTKLNYTVLFVDLHQPQVDLLARKIKHILDPD